MVSLSKAKNTAIAFSAHCQLNHPAEWGVFCASPDVVRLNAVYSKGFQSLKRKLQLTK